MGNNAIIIRTIGCHHNGSEQDAEQLAARFVRELRGAGHSILSAHVETGGGSIDVADLADPQLRALADPDAFARAAYERYCGASGGKSLVSGAELPGWGGLSTPIKDAWRAVVDPLAARHVK